MSHSPESSPNPERLADDEEEEYAEDDGGELGEEGAQDEPSMEASMEQTEDHADLSKYVLQHGAHREYKVPNGLIAHEAGRAMKVKDGHHIGEMVASKSPVVWKGLEYYHVHLIGGTTISGVEEIAPHVCFKPPAGSEETDDEAWLRPIPAKVMEHFQPIWKAAIKAKFADDSNKVKELLKKYSSVLKWLPEQMTGQRLDPKSYFGMGKNSFVLITGNKLKSVRIAPVPVPRNVKGVEKQPTAPSSKVSGKRAASSMDGQSDASDVTAMPDAKVIRIGPEATTSTYVLDGFVYATLMA
jgi:hypothetical protein